MRTASVSSRRLRHVVCIGWLLLVIVSCGSDGGGSSDDSATVVPTATQSIVVDDVPGGATATESSGADVVLSTTFEDDAAGLFFVGETGFGASTSIVNGKYTVDVAQGEWQVISPDPMPQPENGMIEADVALTGSGFAGLVSRSSVDPNGKNWMYVCLLDESGWAGCVASRADDYQDLFWEQIDGYVAGAPQRMRLSVVEDRIELTVNGQAIGSATDATIPSGSWGVFAESLPDSAATITFDNVTIWTTSPNREPGGTPTESTDGDSALSRFDETVWRP